MTQIGDVRRSPDGRRVAIYHGPSSLYPGRPWRATPATVLRPEDVADWTPMQPVWPGPPVGRAAFAPHPFRFAYEGTNGAVCADCGLTQGSRWHWNLPAEPPAGETPRVGVVRSSELGDDWTAAHHLGRNTAMTTPLLSGDTLSALLPDTAAPEVKEPDAAEPEAKEPSVAELLSRVAELTDRLGTAIAQRTAAIGERDAAQQAARLAEQTAQANRFRLEEFQSQVRDVAIRVADERDWCDTGLNEVLAELGLDPKETDWEVTVTVVARVQKTITVSAVDEDAARQKIQTDEDDCVSDTIDDGEFTWDDDDIEIDAVGRP